MGTNRKDNILTQRRLGQIFTCILEWDKGLLKNQDCTLYTARAYTTLVVLVFFWGEMLLKMPLSKKWCGVCALLVAVGRWGHPRRMGTSAWVTRCKVCELAKKSPWPLIGSEEDVLEGSIAVKVCEPLRMSPS